MNNLRLQNRKLPRIDLSNKIKIDIGCGEKPQPNHIGIDIRDCGQEIVWDVRDGIPFPDDSVDEITTSHFLEHLSVGDDVDFIKECLRVLKIKGKMNNRLPHAEAKTAFYPGHRSFWNEEKVEALSKAYDLSEFMILGNKKVGNELFFIIQKL